MSCGWRERERKRRKSLPERDGDRAAVMEETFGNGETEEREMNECGVGIRGGQAAAMAADGCVCLCVCGSGGKGSRLAGSSLRRSGPLIKSEGQTGGLPPSFSSPLPPSFALSLPSRWLFGGSMRGAGEGGGKGGGRREGGREGAGAPTLRVWLPVETVNRGSAVRPETQTGR